MCDFRKARCGGPGEAARNGAGEGSPMSSGCVCAGCHRALIQQHQPEHLVGEPTAQCTVSLAFGISRRQPVPEVVMASTRQADLAYGDAVQGSVDLSVATAVESMPLSLAGRRGNRSRAIVHGERCPRAEARDVSGLAQQLGCSQSSTTLEL